MKINLKDGKIVLDDDGSILLSDECCCPTGTGTGTGTGGGGTIVGCCPDDPVPDIIYVTWVATTWCHLTNGVTIPFTRVAALNRWTANPSDAAYPAYFSGGWEMQIFCEFSGVWRWSMSHLTGHCTTGSFVHPDNTFTCNPFQLNMVYYKFMTASGPGICCGNTGFPLFETPADVFLVVTA